MIDRLSAGRPDNGGRTAAAVALLATLLLTTFPVLGAQDVNEIQDADPEGRVEISNISGAVTVSGWERSAIEITGTLGRGVERLDFLRDGELTLIEVVYPERASSGASYLHIRVPTGSDLQVTTVSASIQARDVHGRQRLTTVSGDLVAQSFGEDLEAETVSGDITITGNDVTAHTALKVVSGNIETTSISGELDASTVSGRIRASGRALSRARLGTTSGRIQLNAGLLPGGRFDLSTTSGRIELLLDHDADLDVDAQTFSGSIGNCFGVEPTRSRFTPERTLRYQGGEANRSVRIRSMSGRIDVCSGNRAEAEET